MVTKLRLAWILAVFALIVVGCSSDQVTSPTGSDINGQTGLSASDVVTLATLNRVQDTDKAKTGADVAVTDFTGPAVVYPGDVMHLQATVANIGTEVAVGPFDAWIGVLGTNFEFGRVTLGSLEAGGERTGVVNFQIPASRFAKAYPPGVYTLYCAHSYADGNPSNDYKLIDVELKQGPMDGFIWVPEGSFTMGSPLDEPGREPDETVHQVTLTKGFWISPYKVTEELWDQVMGSGNSNSQKPKVNVTWYDAVEFCNAYSLEHGLTPAYVGSDTTWTWDQTANGYRLPTEAEWEYACRAGSTTPFANGDITELYCAEDPNLDAMGWYCYNSNGQTQPVGQKQPNAWGLYDMHGNVYEWCWDWYGAYVGDAVDPTGPATGDARVLRGGAWDGGARYCRSANRLYYPPSTMNTISGFRLVRSGQ